MDLNRIYNMDCLDGMKQMSADFVDLTVTSPPYDNLRNYHGFSFDFHGIANELLRITKPGGVVVWIVNDATIDGSETGTSFKQALYFKEIGFNLHDTMIYASDKPPLTHNRYEQKFEYMFILSKGKPKTFNPIMEKCSFAGSTPMGTFRHTGEETQKAHKQDKVKSHKIRGNIWWYSTGYQKTTTDQLAYQHPAIFPEKLAQDHILSWSNAGDIVLDPFMGSGTTAKMALLNNRQYIGFEISPVYCAIAEKRIKSAEKRKESQGMPLFG